MTAGDSGRIVILGAGIAALSAALRLAPRPVLVISPDSDDDVIRQAVGAGVSAYVVDGLQPERL